eukprot:s14429_g1.t1
MPYAWEANFRMLNQQKIQRLQEEDRKHAAFQFRADEVMALAPSQEHLRQQHRDQVRTQQEQAELALQRRQQDAEALRQRQRFSQEVLRQQQRERPIMPACSACVTASRGLPVQLACRLSFLASFWPRVESFVAL